MNKLLIIPLVLLLAGGGLLAYSAVSYTINYTVTVHDTTIYAPNIILVSDAQIALTLNEGETKTSTITLQNTGNAEGTVTLSTSSTGAIAATFEDDAMSLTVTLNAGQTLNIPLTIRAPTNVNSDTTYTVTVSVS